MPSTLPKRASKGGDHLAVGSKTWLSKAGKANAEIAKDNQELLELVKEARSLAERAKSLPPGQFAGPAGRALRASQQALKRRVEASPARHRKPKALTPPRGRTQRSAFMPCDSRNRAPLIAREDVDGDRKPQLVPLALHLPAKAAASSDAPAPNEILSRSVAPPQILVHDKPCNGAAHTKAKAKDGQQDSASENIEQGKQPVSQECSWPRTGANAETEAKQTEGEGSSSEQLLKTPVGEIGTLEDGTTAGFDEARQDSQDSAAAETECAQLETAADVLARAKLAEAEKNSSERMLQAPVREISTLEDTRTAGFVKVSDSASGKTQQQDHGLLTDRMQLETAADEAARSPEQLLKTPVEETKTLEDSAAAGLDVASLDGQDRASSKTEQQKPILLTECSQLETAPDAEAGAKPAEAEQSSSKRVLKAPDEETVTLDDSRTASLEEACRNDLDSASGKTEQQEHGLLTQCTQLEAAADAVAGVGTRPSEHLLKTSVEEIDTREDNAAAKLDEIALCGQAGAAGEAEQQEHTELTERAQLEAIPDAEEMAKLAEADESSSERVLPLEVSAAAKSDVAGLHGQGSAAGEAERQEHTVLTECVQQENFPDAEERAKPAEADEGSPEQILPAPVGEHSALEDSGTAGVDEASQDCQDSASGQTEQPEHDLPTHCTQLETAADEVAGPETRSSEHLLKTSVGEISTCEDSAAAESDEVGLDGQDSAAGKTERQEDTVLTECAQQETISDAEETAKPAEADESSSERVLPAPVEEHSALEDSGTARVDEASQDCWDTASGQTEQREHDLPTDRTQLDAAADEVARAERASSEQLVKTSDDETNTLEDRAAAELDDAGLDGQDSASEKTGQQHHTLLTQCAQLETESDVEARAKPAKAGAGQFEPVLKTSAEEIDALKDSGTVSFDEASLDGKDSAPGQMEQQKHGLRTDCTQPGTAAEEVPVMETRSSKQFFKTPMEEINMLEDSAAAELDGVGLDGRDSASEKIEQRKPTLSTGCAQLGTVFHAEAWAELAEAEQSSSERILKAPNEEIDTREDGRTAGLDEVSNGASREMEHREHGSLTDYTQLETAADEVARLSEQLSKTSVEETRTLEDSVAAGSDVAGLGGRDSASGKTEQHKHTLSTEGAPPEAAPITEATAKLAEAEHSSSERMLKAPDEEFDTLESRTVGLDEASPDGLDSASGKIEQQEHGLLTHCSQLEAAADAVEVAETRSFEHVLNTSVDERNTLEDSAAAKSDEVGLDGQGSAAGEAEWQEHTVLTECAQQDNIPDAEERAKSAEADESSPNRILPAPVGQHSALEDSGTAGVDEASQDCQDSASGQTELPEHDLPTHCMQLETAAGEVAGRETRSSEHLLKTSVGDVTTREDSAAAESDEVGLDGQDSAAGKTERQEDTVLTECVQHETIPDAEETAKPAEADESSSERVLPAPVEEHSALEDSGTARVDEASQDCRDTASGQTEQREHDLPTDCTQLEAAADEVAGAETRSSKLFFKTAVDEINTLEDSAAAELDEAGLDGQNSASEKTEQQHHTLLTRCAQLETESDAEARAESAEADTGPFQPVLKSPAEEIDTHSRTMGSDEASHDGQDSASGQTEQQKHGLLTDCTQPGTAAEEVPVTERRSSEQLFKTSMEEIKMLEDSAAAELDGAGLDGRDSASEKTEQQKHTLSTECAQLGTVPDTEARAELAEAGQSSSERISKAPNEEIDTLGDSRNIGLDEVSDSASGKMEHQEHGSLTDCMQLETAADEVARPCEQLLNTSVDEINTLEDSVAAGLDFAGLDARDNASGKTEQHKHTLSTEGAPLEAAPITEATAKLAEAEHSLSVLILKAPAEEIKTLEDSDEASPGGLDSATGKMEQQEHGLLTHCVRLDTAADEEAGAETRPSEHLLKTSVGEVNASEDSAAAELDEFCPDGPDSAAGKTERQEHTSLTKCAQQETLPDAEERAKLAEADESSSERVLPAPVGEHSALEDSGTAGVDEASQDCQDSASGQTELPEHDLPTHCTQLETAADEEAGPETRSSEHLLKTPVEEINTREDSAAAESHEVGLDGQDSAAERQEHTVLTERAQQAAPDAQERRKPAEADKISSERVLPAPVEENSALEDGRTAGVDEVSQDGRGSASGRPEQREHGLLTDCSQLEAAADEVAGAARGSSEQLFKTSVEKINTPEDSAAAELDEAGLDGQDSVSEKTEQQNHALLTGCVQLEALSAADARDSPAEAEKGPSERVLKTPVEEINALEDSRTAGLDEANQDGRDSASKQMEQHEHGLLTDCTQPETAAEEMAGAETISSEQHFKASIGEINTLEDSTAARLDETGLDGPDSASEKTEQQRRTLLTECAQPETAPDAEASAKLAEAARSSSKQSLKAFAEGGKTLSDGATAGLDAACLVDDGSEADLTATLKLDDLGVDSRLDQLHGVIEAPRLPASSVAASSDLTSASVQPTHMPNCVKVLMQECQSNLGLGLKQQSIGGKSQLLVQEVFGNGAVADHNIKQTTKGCHDQIVLPGMLLVGVNSIEMKSELILEALTSGSIVDVLFAKQAQSCVKVSMQDGIGNLGLGLKQRTVGGKQELVVEEVLQNGAVANHNAKQISLRCNDQLIQPGMRLVGVNGVETSLPLIFEALASGSTLDVLFSMPQDSKCNSTSNMDGALKALQAFRRHRQHMKPSVSDSKIHSASIDRQPAFVSRNPANSSELGQVVKKLAFTGDVITEDARSHPAHHQHVPQHNQVQTAGPCRSCSAPELNRQQFTVRIQKGTGGLGLMFKPPGSGRSAVQELFVVSVEPTGAVARHNAHQVSLGRNDLVVEPAMRITAVNSCRGDATAMVEALSFGNVVELELSRQSKRAEATSKQNQIIGAVKAVQQMKSSLPRHQTDEDSPGSFCRPPSTRESQSTRSPSHSVTSRSSEY